MLIVLNTQGSFRQATNLRWQTVLKLPSDVCCAFQCLKKEMCEIQMAKEILVVQIILPPLYFRSN